VARTSSLVTQKTSKVTYKCTWAEINTEMHSASTIGPQTMNENEMRQTRISCGTENLWPVRIDEVANIRVCLVGEKIWVLVL